MTTPDPILDALHTNGEILETLDQQDSGCVSYVWRPRGRDIQLIKSGVAPSARPGLERAWRLHQEVSHPTLVPPLSRMEGANGDLLALAFPFLPGELLYDYTRWTSYARQHDPASPHSRFRALPALDIFAAFDAILDAHIAIERAGWVAVDLYDGCLLYDFGARVVRLIDLDEYHPDPFTLERERLPGSKRFMAPEEFVRGSRIDARTNVFTLGRMASVLLTQTQGVWAHGDALAAVITRATQADPSDRYESVEDLARTWRHAV